jgi:type I restriction enzyme S subunit
MSDYQLPEGYKQTEIGVIPEDWDVKEFGNLGKFKNGINKSSEDFGYGSPFVNLMDVFGISFIEDNTHLGLVNSNEIEKKVYDLRKGDVLFIRSSVKPSGVGLTTVINCDLADTVYSGFLIRFRDSGCLEKDFKKYCFSEEKLRQRVIANSTVSANTNINQDNLKKIPIAYPKSIKEQHAIAATLSDVDALIAALDNLIAKQRHLKTATMQQLLTGKKRLPGFSGEWIVQQLGEISEIVMGQSPSSLNYNLKGEGLPLIQGNADIVERQTIKRVFTLQITKLGKSGDILMTVRAPVGQISQAKFDICLGRGVCALRFPNTFLYHFLISIESTWAKHSKGSTFDSVNSSDISAIKVNLPSDAQEQRAIATVLSDMDAAISALETRRAKTQAIKQGMMQELLTGKTRLINNE